MFCRFFYITLFSFFVIFPIYGQTNFTDLSCKKSNSPLILKSILTRFAIDSDLTQMNQYIDNLNQQIILDNNSSEITEVMEAIKTSLESGNNFKELSAIYSSNISEYNSYELFTSNIFCKQINSLTTEDMTLMKADSILENKLIEKLISPYTTIPLLTAKSVQMPASNEAEMVKKTNQAESLKTIDSDKKVEKSRPLKPRHRIGRKKIERRIISLRVSMNWVRLSHV